MLLTLAAPFVTYIQAGAEAERKYRLRRELDAERLAQLKETYYADPVKQQQKQAVEEKPKKPSKRQLKRQKLKQERKQRLLQRGKDGK